MGSGPILSRVPSLVAVATLFATGVAVAGSPPEVALAGARSSHYGLEDPLPLP